VAERDDLPVKAVVRRYIDEVINNGRLDALDELCTSQMAAGAKRWIAPFRESFPDVHMEIVQLVAETTRSSAGSAARRRIWASGVVSRRAAARSATSTRCTSSRSRMGASPRRGAWRTTSRARASSASNDRT
jgi:hypothetical protein